MEGLPRPKLERRVVLWVVGAFALGILAWGTSMYALKRNLLRTVDLLMREREREKSLEAWIKRAKDLHVSYEDALFNPEQAVGKPVLWEIRVVDSSGTLSYVDEDFNKPVRWTNPDALAKGLGHGGGMGGRDFPVVAVIRGVVAPDSVRRAMGKPDSQRPYGVSLEYLGYQ